LNAEPIPLFQLSEDVMNPFRRRDFLAQLGMGLKSIPDFGKLLLSPPPSGKRGPLIIIRFVRYEVTDNPDRGHPKDWQPKSTAAAPAATTTAETATGTTSAAIGDGGSDNDAGEESGSDGDGDPPIRRRSWFSISTCFAVAASVLAVATCLTYFTPGWYLLPFAGASFALAFLVALSYDPKHWYRRRATQVLIAMISINALSGLRLSVTLRGAEGLQLDFPGVGVPFIACAAACFIFLCWLDFKTQNPSRRHRQRIGG
jgi:hypothetical protein